MRKIAKANVIPVRQQTQYNCVTTSLAMALRALGVSEDECGIERVNKVVGAMPLQGAAWEPMLAAANHYGMRATLTLPSTVAQLKAWTDAGKPVVIAWNPEGREWSHASLVFDVTEDETHGFLIHIADPNIPDPEETVRVVPKKEFYSKWYEKASQGYMIRRPACVIEREITPEGRQVMALNKTLQDRYFKTAAPYNPDRNRGLSREELQEGWADSRQNAPTYFSQALAKAKMKRSSLFAPWYQVLNWWENYGTPHQKELVEWTKNLPEEGLPRNPNEVYEYERAYTKVKDVYDHPSGKGRELFEEVQRALDLPTPLTHPPSDADKLLALSLKPSGDFGKALDRVTAYESKLTGIQAQIEKELNRQVSLAINALPEDMQAWVASKGVRVFVDRPHNLGMPAEEIEGKPSDVPNNVHVAVGYTVHGGIELGRLQGYALWERRFSFGVLPFFEKSPKPRLFRMTVVSRGGNVAFLDLTGRSGAVYPPGKGSLGYSVTKAQYEKAKTLPQTRSVVDEISESFGKSVAVWMAWERKQEDRKKAEADRAEEQERKSKEEAVRKEMEAPEALRRKENARAKAPPTPKNVVESALSEKFAILDQLLANGFPQAQAAAREVKDAYQAGGKPSEDQLRALRNIMYRSKMRAEADQFRVASLEPSPSRVVRLFFRSFR